LYIFKVADMYYSCFTAFAVAMLRGIHGMVDQE
jgi:hypothetical protein